ncbi:alpha/beta-hydrolase [Hypoxylon sp. FL1284]|nr:alpha/beta-hydrolase [Hypoxylon sp. FL1284]
MSSITDLAVIVCHGSWHTPAPYMPLVDALKAKGVEAYCPQLPTSDLTKLNVGDVNNPDLDREPPEGGYPGGEEEAEVITSLLRSVIGRGKKVLLLGHSAGGWVATEAARPELQAKSRKAQGQAGGVIGILHMGAFIIPVGESINSFVQARDGAVVAMPWMTFHKHGPAGLGTMVQTGEFLFHDLAPGEAEKWAATLAPSPILTSRLTNDGYAALPCAYLVLDGDRILPKVYQEAMVAAQSQKTGPFTIYHCPAGHSAHLSWTSGVVDTVLDFLKKIEG